MKTYGQGVITPAEFDTQVKNGMLRTIGKKVTTDEVSKLYKKGYSVSDAISYLIMRA